MAILNKFCVCYKYVCCPCVCGVYIDTPVVHRLPEVKLEQNTYSKLLH